MNGDKWNEIMKISWNSLTLITICQIYMWSCVFIAIFLLALCLGSLKLSWCGAKRNSCWGGHSKVFQGEPRTTFILNFQVVCMCDYLDKVTVRFAFCWRQNIAKYGHVLNLVVWMVGIIYALRFVNPQIECALLYCLISISYILNVRILGLNSKICWS